MKFGGSEFVVKFWIGMIDMIFCVSGKLNFEYEYVY